MDGMELKDEAKEVKGKPENKKRNMITGIIAIVGTLIALIMIIMFVVDDEVAPTVATKPKVAATTNQVGSMATKPKTAPTSQDIIQMSQTLAGMSNNIARMVQTHEKSLEANQKYMKAEIIALREEIPGLVEKVVQEKLAKAVEPFKQPPVTSTLTTTNVTRADLPHVVINNQNWVGPGGNLPPPQQPAAKPYWLRDLP